MRGHVVKKGVKYFPVLELGHVPALRCASCGKRAGWLSEGELDSCPKCGGELVERQERRQRWLQGHTRKKDAQAALSAIVAEADRSGAYVEPSRRKLADYLVSSWLPAVRSTIRPSTYASYEETVRVHLVPTLGHIELRALAPSHLNAAYATWLENGRSHGSGGLSANSVRHFHVVLHRALKDAVRWGLLTRNVCELASPPRPRRVEMKVWSSEQMATFLAATATERLHPVWVLACTSGLRRGELLGLRWADLDLDATRLQVRQTLISVAYELHFSIPKTAKGNRSIALDTHTVGVLRTWRKSQLEERLQWGGGYEDLDLVFCRENGSPMHPAILSKAFRSAAKAAGLPIIRFHDLRHSHATAALSAGVHPKVISERLGHSSVGITLDLYSHTVPAMEVEAASKIAGLIFGA